MVSTAQTPRPRAAAGCLGIDGCPAGWVAIARDGAWVAAGLAALLERLAPAVVAIDMPIGLAEHGPRACERAARRRLGWPRSSSVFPVPVRRALPAASHAEASDLNAAACGRRLSAQTFNIMGRIREVDALLRGSPHWRARVYETHPEVCFAAMNAGTAIVDSKRRAAGQARRRTLLDERFTARAFSDARRAIAKRHAADDDIADAFACLFSAKRIAAGVALCLPESPDVDAHGLPMRIVV